MHLNSYFSGYNLKNSGRKQKLGYTKNVQFGWENFTLSLVAYIIVDLKKLISNLSQAYSALLESKSFKRKTRLLE